MHPILMFIFVYFLWFVDLGLAAWLAFISRTALFALPAVFFHRGSIFYSSRAEVIDTVFTLLIGLGWITFAVLVLEYYQPGKQKENLIIRFATVTGPLVVCIFIVDSILFYLQGFDAHNWLRWLIISSELVVGITLVIYSRKYETNKPK